MWSIFKKLKRLMRRNREDKVKEKHCRNLVRKLETLYGRLEVENNNLDGLLIHLEMYRRVRESRHVDFTTTIPVFLSRASKTLIEASSLLSIFQIETYRAMKKLVNDIKERDYPEIVEIDQRLPLWLAVQIEVLTADLGIYCYKQPDKQRTDKYKIKIYVDMH